MKERLVKLFTDPLTHFLFVGLALFVLFDLTGTAEVIEDDSKTIIVDDEALLTFVQYRTRVFDEDRARERLESMSERELGRLIDDFVREEALHREALALNLQAHDYIIRRRLVQGVEYITQNLAEAASDVDDEGLNEYFEAHVDDYYVEPVATFTHVFMDAERRGAAEALALAEAKLVELNESGAVLSDASQHTEHFPYHLNYVERTYDFVRSHFGPTMTDALFALQPSDSAWHGPYQSSYGAHLVMVTRIAQGRHPELDEIRDRVAEDARQARIREQSEGTVQEIIDAYDVQISYGSNAESDDEMVQQ